MNKIQPDSQIHEQETNSRRHVEIFLNNSSFSVTDGEEELSENRPAFIRGTMNIRDWTRKGIG